MGKVTELVWDAFPSGGSDLLAMLVFAEEGNSQGKHIKPSLNTICHRMRLGERQARRVVNGLIEQGWIKVIDNEFGGSGPREYEIAVERLMSGVEQKCPPVASDPPKTKRDAGSSGTRLPKDWTLPEEWAAWTTKERPDLDPRKVAEVFKDHWIAKAGREARKADWLATWRNWVRAQKEPKHETHNRPDNSAPGRVRAAQERRDRAEGRTFEHKPH